MSHRIESARPIFAWFDLWVGVFIDRPKRRVYVFSVPCMGFVIQIGGDGDGRQLTERADGEVCGVCPDSAAAVITGDGTKVCWYCAEALEPADD